MEKKDILPLQSLFIVSFLLVSFSVQAIHPKAERENNDVVRSLPKPTKGQAQWQDYEIGIFYHYDMNVFKPGWDHRKYDDFPKPEIFNPTKLDMQQWMEVSKALDAKYAVLTATHGSGFMLWQSDAYPYGMKQSPYKNGKGDIVKDFVETCRLNGVAPGLYCHMRVNGWWQVDHPGFVNLGKGGDPDLQAKYAAAKIQQVKELWGNYGQLAEIWFDGGLPDPKAGYDVLPLVKKLQPKAMIYGGGNSPVETIRWVGWEKGKVGYPCWSTGVNPFDATKGVPDGKDWCPGEADVDLLGGAWMWSPDSDQKLLSLNELMDIYYKSVGHNCNLLINAAPGPDGRIPEAQLQRFREFGLEIKRRFGTSLAETSGKGNIVEIPFSQPKTIDHVILMEQITKGERVREYVLEGKVGDQWQKIGDGSCIGHKRIQKIDPIEVSAVRLRVIKSVGEPIIRKLAVYYTIVPEKEFFGKAITQKNATTLSFPSDPGDPGKAVLPEMPEYQYPPQVVNIANAANWKWMKAFYSREVSQPAAEDETLEQVTLRAARVKPTPEKLAYLDMELITFPHFGMSTVSGQQQGTGKEDPRSFNPTKFDAREWVRFHKAIGAKMIVFVAKHHDGFTLWPSKLNDYNISSSPWRDGKGDMVREMAEACRERGIKLGLYISLWDEHDPRCINPRPGADKMTPEQRKIYQDYVEQQLLETLISYGEISELWFDGAGSNGAEDWNRIFEIVHHFQPKCLVAMCGFGARWCGNESAVGDAVNWNVLPLLPELRKHEWVPYHFGQLISKKLPTVTDNLENLRGQDLFFIPQEGDTRVLNGGWHWDGVGEPRSLEFLINTWYASIGSGANLIFSPAPDATGAFNDKQLDRLVELRRWIDGSFSNNLLKGAKLTLSGGDKGYNPEQLISGDRKNPCISDKGSANLSLTAEFSSPQTFNNLVVEEFIATGQRISAFVLEAWQKGVWTTVTEGRTVGHKRVLPFSEVTTDKIRFRITASRDLPVLRFLGLYKALPYLENSHTFAAAEYHPALPEQKNLNPGLRWTYFEDAGNSFLPYQELFSNLNTNKVKAIASGLDPNPMKIFNNIPKTQKRKEHFAMRFDGYFRAPARAVYTFQAGANSGCRLYIDGKPLIENDESGGLQGKVKTGEVPLESGLHQITILSYFGSAGQPKLTLVAEWPGNAGGDGFGWSSFQRLLPLLWSEASR